MATYFSTVSSCCLLTSGPISLSASSGSPTLIAIARLTSSPTKRSWMDRSTSRREPAEQTSPAPAKIPMSAPSMAASKSASANTMLGLLPPSSRPIFFTFSAPRRMMLLPTSTDPVNATMSTSLWPAR